ncbi:MAG: carboxylating nicotinate-nucleotide diphosphorylase [Flavobacteriales bacterium]|nr:carboxylating nicotinate-nucleotide diphosphorylase [Flavobacteriales bacterium]
MMNLETFVRLALEEDVRDGDHTSLACIPEDAQGSMYMLIKEDGVLAGLEVAVRIFHLIDPDIQVDVSSTDGRSHVYGDIPLRVMGDVHSLLIAERLVLNILQRMSGIATKTRSTMNLISHTNTKILDTRKTTPLFRYFEKEAVRIGGGTNHRMGLYDAMMIKDNHIDFAGGISRAITRCTDYQKAQGLDLDIIVEARDMEEVNEILDNEGVRRILLDNFSVAETKEAVTVISGQTETESSGGITKENIVPYAECGVDFISMGALTHKVRSLDISLKAEFDVQTAD